MQCEWYSPSGGQDTDGECLHPEYYELDCGDCPLLLEQLAGVVNRMERHARAERLELTAVSLPVALKLGMG